MNNFKPKWLKKTDDHSCLKFLNFLTSTQNISGYYPYILNLDPSSISNTNIYQIKYIIDNEEIANFKFFPSITLEKDLSIEHPPQIPYPFNIGDPRNHQFSHFFNNISSSNLTHSVSVLIYSKGTTQPVCNSFQLFLSSQQTLMGTLSNGFFEDISLLKHQMFGPNNDIVYFLETKSPNYLLPVLVNWNN